MVAVLIALMLATTGCTTVPTASGYGQECAEFQPDAGHPFFEVNRTYLDSTPLPWPASTPAAMGIDAAILDTAADEVALSPAAASLLVVRHGRLVFERYFNGFNAADSKDLHSLTKSITSILTGIAIDEGYLDLDTRIDQALPPGLVVDHGELTVRDLLRMAGGLEPAEPDGNYEWEPSEAPGEPSLVRAVLSSQKVAEPGTEFLYNSGLTHMLAAMVAEATGMSLCEFAADHLFGPLGIDVEAWHVEPGGYFTGGFGMFLTPREIARFGQLALDRGASPLRRIVSEDWLDQSLSEQWDLGCPGFLPVERRYGYLWWGYTIGGHEVWVASGYGGQDVAIVPDLELVVVMTHDTAEGEALRADMPALLHELVLGAVDGEPAPRPATECNATSLRMAIASADATGTPMLVKDWPEDVAGPFSLDRSALAFSRRFVGLYDLYTIDPEDERISRITRDAESDAMPAWSPSGNTIVFARGDPAQSDLYVIGSDGSGLSQLTALDGFEQGPTWSPDGQRIAFIWGHNDVRGWGWPGELWVIDADGSNLELLVDREVSNPAWSPDGTRIVFDTVSGDGRVWVLDVASGGVRDLGEGVHPAWSPDGTRIAFVHLEDGAGDVFTMAADGASRIRLTDTPEHDTLPGWSASGETIIFWTLTERN